MDRVGCQESVHWVSLRNSNMQVTLYMQWGYFLTWFVALETGTANNAGAILVLGRDLVVVPKLIHPIPPALTSPESSPEHHLEDTWMQVNLLLPYLCKIYVPLLPCCICDLVTLLVLWSGHMKWSVNCNTIFINSKTYAVSTFKDGGTKTSYVAYDESLDAKQCDKITVSGKLILAL